MALSKVDLEASLEILKVLDDAILSGPWEYNLFYRGMGKRLQAIRARFIQDLGLEEYIAGLENPESVESSEEKTEEFLTVYVSLYQAEGANINKWQTVVNSLAGYNVTRPVYQNESDIQETIKAKAFQQNDAYVAVKIRKEDIMPQLSSKLPVDRQGHPLLVLREGAIKLENILKLTHLSGQYDYKSGTLLKRS